MPAKLAVPVRIATGLVAAAALATFPLLLIHFDRVLRGFEEWLPGTAFGVSISVISIGFAPVLAVFCLLSAISGHDMFRVIAMLLDPATDHLSVSRESAPSDR